MTCKQPRAFVNSRRESLSRIHIRNADEIFFIQDKARQNTQRSVGQSGASCEADANHSPERERGGIRTRTGSVITDRDAKWREHE